MTISEKATAETIRELILDNSLQPGEMCRPYAKRIYMTKIVAPLEELVRTLSRTGVDKEEIKDIIIQRAKEQEDSFIRAIKDGGAFRELHYANNYKALKGADKEGITSWGDLFTEIPMDDEMLSEIFVRLVEEQEGVEVTSAKQLQELTGIKEIYGYFDEEKGGIVPYNGTKEPTKKEAQAEAFKQVADCFTSAMCFRYCATLEALLRNGGKYKELLSVKAEDFYLPQEKADYVLRRTIALSFNLYDSRAFRPDLRTVADELQAPYEVILRASTIGDRDGD